MPGMDIKLTVENVHALSAGTSTQGTLKLTNFHIIFSAPFPAKEETTTTTTTPSTTEKTTKQPPAIRYRESWITYPIIAQCTYRPTPQSSAIHSSIRLRCRDFNFVCFNFSNDRQAREVFEFVRNRTCRVGCIEKLYAFSYNPPRQEREIGGWQLYDARAEFRRQGISEKLEDKGWRISSINKDYGFSPTYPHVLVVPSKISDNVLKYAGQFRSRARIPVLTYYHPVTQCSITRSSQPLVGVRNNRSIQDERLVSACFYKSTDVFSGAVDSSAAATSGTSTPVTTEDSVIATGTNDGSADTFLDAEHVDDDTLAASYPAIDEKTGSRIVGARRDNLIVDARPAINSYAMQVVGKGSENMDYYKCATKMFLSIDNIHVMRDSLNKVIDAIKDADVSPLPPNRELLAKSGWLKHIRGILAGSQVIARQVGVRAAHVLIHCSDGWDRTSQLSALSQIMLDPYYRTIDGFIVLVEKDWLSFGHMFQQRSGHLNSEKWFSVQNDAMAGTRIEPGEGDGRGSEVFDNAVASARRFFKKSLAPEREESDADSATAEDIAPSSTSGGSGGNSKSEDNQATRPREISPVFHQFLDATYQLLRQHPRRFEFNERFIRRMLYHLYSCQYGTFLYNNERQRRQARVDQRTASVWDYFLSRRPEFVNPDYDPSLDVASDRLLFPRLKDIRWWHQVFNRTDEDMNASLNAAAAAAAERTAAAALHAATTTTTTTTAPSDSGSSSTVNVQPSPRRGATPQPPPSQLQAASSQSQLSQTAQPQLKPPQPSQPPPPSLTSSHSDLDPAAVARSMLSSDPSPPASLPRSVSAHEPGAFASLRDGIAGLGIGQKVGGVLGSLGAAGGGGGNSSSGSGSGSGAGSSKQHDSHGSRSSHSGDYGDQELREMS